MNVRRSFLSLARLLVVSALITSAVSPGLAADRGIHDAARRNDLKRVRELLRQDPKLVNAKGDGEVTPLHEAARYGSVEMVELLLDQGADIRARCYNQFTPLHFARDVKIARTLIRRGADAKAKSADGTPLKQAVQAGDLAMVELLLEATSEELDFDSLVKLGRTNAVAKMLNAKPWLAKPPSRALHSAAHQGDFELCKLLVEHGADPNLDSEVMNVNGPDTPLTDAVTGGHYQITELFLKRGANPNISAGRNHNSLLLFAIAYLDARFLKSLLDHGADVDYIDPWDGRVTPLHVAAALGGARDAARGFRAGQPSPPPRDKQQVTAKLKLLLDSDADANARSDDGSTPLLFAAIAGNHQACDLLLENGATLDVYSAILLGKREAFESFLKANPKLAVAKQNPLQRSLLHWVARTGDLAMARRLLELGADPNAQAPSLEHQDAGGFGTGLFQDAAGETPLQVAARNGHAQVARLLIEHGARVDAKAGERTPLITACDGGHDKVVEVLLAHGAKFSLDQTDVINAAMEHVTILKMLFAAANNPSLANQRGSELLATAAQWEQKDAVELFLARGAQPDFMTACMLGRVDEVRKFVEADPKLANRAPGEPRRVSSPLEVAVQRGYVNVIEVLIAHGAELGPTERGDESLLHLAAELGRQNVITLLLARGLKLDATNESGATLLHSAARGVQPEIVRFLLAQGADASAADRAGNTPLHLAAGLHGRDMKDPAMIARIQSVGQLLIDAGANVNAQDNNGWTPLHEAAGNGHVELTERLILRGADVNARNHRNETPLKWCESQSRFRAYLGGRDTSPVADLLRRHGGVRKVPDTVR